MASIKTGLSSLKNASVVFWDFDGVVKESLEVKAAGFAKLFAPYGLRVLEKVRSHNDVNGGMSRWEKIPIYLQYAGETETVERVTELCIQFSQLTGQGVVNSAWVPGVENYLRTNPNDQVFVLVSATPLNELQATIKSLELNDVFSDIFGYPVPKHEAIFTTLENLRVNPRDCIMVGDALADLEAANRTDVPFLLRRHKFNADLFSDYSGPFIYDLTVS